MTALCPQCQALQRPTARFCRRCGAPLAESSPATSGRGADPRARTREGSLAALGTGEGCAVTVPWREEGSEPRARVVRPASPLLRLQAVLWDLVLLLGVAMGTVLVAVALRGPLMLADMALWSALAAGLVWGANHLILCSVRGQSVGMALVGIRLVRADGRPLSWGRALLRHTLGWGVAGLSLGIGFLWMFVDARGRGWSDLVSGTCVVEEVSHD